MTITVSKLQSALKEATQEIPTTTEFEDIPTPATVFTPPSHIRALRLQTSLVTGARGAGKTFWTMALQQKSIRRLLERDVPDLVDVRVSVGYTNKANPDSYPSPKIFSQLLKTYSPVDIWRTIWIRAIISQLNASNLKCPCSRNDWLTDVKEVTVSTEAVDRFFFEANKMLARSGARILVLFDALDRVAETWEDIDNLTIALLQTVLQISTYSHIKGKVFLREDHFHRLDFTFPDSSKLLATNVLLSWKRTELYGLLWKRFCNTSGSSGELFRQLFTEFLPEGLQEKGGIWNFSPSVELIDDKLRPLFHVLTGPYMGKDRRRGIPYIWTVGHLADARQHTSPRSFLAAIRRACEDSRENHMTSKFAIHYESIKQGVQAASEIRVNEMKEDNPWVGGLLESLKGVTVPCLFQDIQTIWNRRYPNGPKELAEKHTQYAPPEFSSLQWLDIRKKLEHLGFCMTMSDGRFNMPDLYRVGFGLGRKGGVKPLK